MRPRAAAEVFGVFAGARERTNVVRRILTPALVGATLTAAAARPSSAQRPAPSGREAVETLDFEPLSFDPPVANRHLVAGVPVFHLEDRSLPLVTFTAHFDGGYTRFPRASYAPALGLASLLRNGGSSSFPPDSVDLLFERYAIQATFTSTGSYNASSMNVLTEHVDTALAIWGDVVGRPTFDRERVEIWRGRELERLRRRSDDPSSLAFAVFNRIMYGDHPIGWQLNAVDLAPGALTPRRLRRLHARVFCTDNLILGVTGDLSWDEAEPRIRALLSLWPACREPLPEPPDPEVRADAGVFLLPTTRPQSTVVMAHSTEIHEADDPDYFASRVANSVLGGSGFQSRLMTRLRTQEGLTYSVSSLWTAPRDSPGLFGAVTTAEATRTAEVAEAIVEVVRGAIGNRPSSAEVRSAVDRYVNGFVFNFETPDQIVSRQILYEAVDLPPDWLDRYLRGMQAVTADDVRRVVFEHLDPDRMTILVVGDPDVVAGSLERLGPVTLLEPDGTVGAGPSGGRRLRR